MQLHTILLVFFVSPVFQVGAFGVCRTARQHKNRQDSASSSRALRTSCLHATTESKFSLTIDLPPSKSRDLVRVNFESLMSGDETSEALVVRYQVPFGLNVAPSKGLVVCTEDGTGGEQKGDILRYTSRFTMGLPRGDGIATTAASFAGGIQWQCSLFDVMSARTWEEVVEALTSNTQDRTDEVVLVFERPSGQKQLVTDGDTN